MACNTKLNVDKSDRPIIIMQPLYLHGTSPNFLCPNAIIKTGYLTREGFKSIHASELYLFQWHWVCIDLMEVRTWTCEFIAITRFSTSMRAFWYPGCYHLMVRWGVNVTNQTEQNCTIDSNLLDNDLQANRLVLGPDIDMSVLSVVLRSFWYTLWPYSSLLGDFRLVGWSLKLGVGGVSPPRL